MFGSILVTLRTMNYSNANPSASYYDTGNDPKKETTALHHHVPIILSVKYERILNNSENRTLSETRPEMHRLPQKGTRTIH